MESPREREQPHTVWAVGLGKCGANVLGRKKGRGVNVIERVEQWRLSKMALDTHLLSVQLNMASHLCKCRPLGKECATSRLCADAARESRKRVREGPNRPHVSREQGVTDRPLDAGYRRCLSFSPEMAASPGTEGASLYLRLMGCLMVASRRNSVESTGCEATTSRIPCSSWDCSREQTPSVLGVFLLRANSGTTTSRRASKPASLQKHARSWAMAL